MASENQKCLEEIESRDLDQYNLSKNITWDMVLLTTEWSAENLLLISVTHTALILLFLLATCCTTLVTQIKI